MITDYKCTPLGFSAGLETSSVSLQKPLTWPTLWLSLPTPWDPPLHNPEIKRVSVPRKPLFINTEEELMAKVFCFVLRAHSCEMNSIMLPTRLQ